MNTQQTIVSGLDDGSRAIRDRVGQLAARGTGTPRVIGITGPVGSGKSTLAKMLADAALASIISTDHYLPDYDQTPEHLRDLPEAADLSRLLADLCTLRSGQPANIPQWCFQQHKRVGELRMVPAQLIIVEGLHALHGTHADAIDLRVFVDAPANVRWARWEHLERTGVRGWGVEYARAFFDRVAEPTFDRVANAYRSSAHVIVVNDRGVPTLHDPAAARQTPVP